MPFTPNHQKKFNLYWTDNLTGYNLKLEIRPQHTSAYTTPVVVDIYDAGQIIENWKFAIEYDKYNIGLPAISAEFLFHIDRIEEEHLRWFLINPFSSVFSGNNYQSGISYNLYSANVFSLFVKFPDTIDPYQNWRVVYRGLQQNGVEEEFDFETMTHSIKTACIFKEAMTRANMRSFYAQLLVKNAGSTYENDYGYYESIFKLSKGAPGKVWGYFRGVKDVLHRLYYTRLDELEELIELYLGDILTDLFRDSVVLTASSNKYPKFYKQSYESANPAGSEISPTDSSVYLPITTKTGEDVYEGGFFDIADNYETLWDYLQDQSKELIKQVFFDYAKWEIVYNPILTSNYVDYDLTGKKAELQIRKDIIKRLGVEPIEVFDNDTDKIQVQDNSSRNSNTYNIALINQNIGSNGEYRQIDAAAGISAYDLAQAARIYLNKEIKYNVYLYRDMASIDGTNTLFKSKMILCHPKIEYTVGNGVVSSDIHSQTFISLPYLSENYPAYLATMQADSNGRAIAETIFNVYGNNNQVLIKVSEADLSMDINYTGNDNEYLFDIAYLLRLGGYKLNMSLNNLLRDSINTYFDNLPTKFYITKLEVNNGIVEFEALGLE